MQNSHHLIYLGFANATYANQFNMKSPSRPVRKATKKVTMTKSKLSTKKKNTNAKKSVPQPEAAKAIVTNPVDRLYKTVTLESDDIEDGIWMIRRLGNGKYEAVNLNDAAFEDICSEENEARMASTPKSLEVFKASQKSMKDISLKLDRAIFTASMYSAPRSYTTHAPGQN